MNIDVIALETLPEIAQPAGLKTARRTCKRTKQSCERPTCVVTMVYEHP
jgi:hypothetical protein